MAPPAENWPLSVEKCEINVQHDKVKRTWRFSNVTKGPFRKDARFLEPRPPGFSNIIAFKRCPVFQESPLLGKPL